MKIQHGDTLTTEDIESLLWPRNMKHTHTYTEVQPLIHVVEDSQWHESGNCLLGWSTVGTVYHYGSCEGPTGTLKNDG